MTRVHPVSTKHLRDVLQLDWTPPVVKLVRHDLERHKPVYKRSHSACQSTNKASKSKEL